MNVNLYQKLSNETYKSATSESITFSVSENLALELAKLNNGDSIIDKLINSLSGSKLSLDEDSEIANNATETSIERYFQYVEQYKNEGQLNSSWIVDENILIGSISSRLGFISMEKRLHIATEILVELKSHLKNSKWNFDDFNVILTTQNQIVLVKL